MTYTTFKGVQFEVMNCRPPKIENKKIFDLYKAYKNPSKIKQEIFYEWKNWLLNFDFPSFIYISSYNCHMFTLKGVLYDGLDEYIVEITKYHNRIWIIK